MLKRNAAPLFARAQHAREKVTEVGGKSDNDKTTVRTRMRSGKRGYVIAARRTARAGRPR
jgi:hypothetical protein